MKRAFLLAVLAATPAVAAPLKPGETRIGGHTYLFPPEVFESAVETGRVGTVLLELAWPEMRGLTDEEKWAVQRRPTLLVLVNSAADVDGDAAPADQVLDDVPGELSVALFPDEIGNHTIPRQANRSSPGEAPGGGMVELVRGKDPPGDRGADVYALPPLAHTPEFISCTHTDGVFTISSCSQSFVANDMIVKIDYNHAYVGQWRVIHDRFTSFLKSCEVE